VTQLLHLQELVPRLAPSDGCSGSLSPVEKSCATCIESLPVGCLDKVACESHCGQQPLSPVARLVWSDAQKRSGERTSCCP